MKQCKERIQFHYRGPLAKAWRSGRSQRIGRPQIRTSKKWSQPYTWCSHVENHAWWENWAHVRRCPVENRPSIRHRHVAKSERRSARWLTHRLGSARLRWPFCTSTPPADVCGLYKRRPLRIPKSEDGDGGPTLIPILYIIIK